MIFDGFWRSHGMKICSSNQHPLRVNILWALFPFASNKAFRKSKKSLRSDVTLAGRCTIPFSEPNTLWGSQIHLQNDPLFNDPKKHPSFAYEFLLGPNDDAISTEAPKVGSSEKAGEWPPEKGCHPGKMVAHSWKKTSYKGLIDLGGWKKMSTIYQLFM